MQLTPELSPVILVFPVVMVVHSPRVDYSALAAYYRSTPGSWQTTTKKK
jgi:hypothetical protein